MSVARKLLRQKETEGVVVPYIRGGGFVVYSTPAEIARREGGTPIMTADVLKEISSSVSHETVFDEEMEAALAAAASSAGTIVKPSKLARKRREVGERKERKETRPEIVVEPLTEETPPVPEPPKVEEKPKEAAKKPKKEEKPKKAAPKTEPKKADKKPKKESKTTAKKPAAKKVRKPELVDIEGVGPKKAEKIRESGFKTVAAISKTTAEKLSKKVSGISETTAQHYIDSAKKLIEEYEKAKAQ